MIKSLLGLKETSRLKAPARFGGIERRQQCRQPLPDGLAVLELDESTSISVTDISYGGIGVRLPTGFEAPRKMKRVPMSLSVLGQHIDTDLDLVHTRGQQLGFAFRPREAEACLSIETLVDRLGDGAALREADLFEGNGRRDVTLTNDRGVALTITADSSTGAFLHGDLSFSQWGQPCRVSCDADGRWHGGGLDDMSSALLILVGVNHAALTVALKHLVALSLRRLQDLQAQAGMRVDVIGHKV